MQRLGRATMQLEFLRFEYDRLVRGRPWRYVTVLLTASFWTIAHYRFERALYLLFGRAYVALRTLLLPFFFLTAPWRANSEVHYKADLGKGLRILHPGLGVVVSGATVAGDMLFLTGGNCIGRTVATGEVRLGNNVTLGANAAILGPLTVGDNVMIGAGSLLVSDAPSQTNWGGVPAKRLPDSAGKRLED